MSEVAAAAPAATPSVEPVTVNSGDSSPVTFDELEAVDSRAKAASKAQKQETKEVVKETVKAMGKGDKDGKDKKGSKAEQEDEESGEGKEKKSKKAGEEESTDDVGGNKAPKKEAKKIKAKLGEKEVEIDEDIIVPVKINGKDELIPLKELQSQFSGKVAYDKKFQEMDRERRQFHSKVEEANNKIKSIFEEQDPEMRFYRMAEFSGVDPLEVRQKFLSENMNLLEKWYSMSEDERKADAIAYENKVMKHKLESQAKAQAQEKSKGQLEARIKSLEEAHKFTPDEFWQRYDEIQDLKKAGKLQDQVTPEFVAETIAKDRLWNSAAKIFDANPTSLNAEGRQRAIFDLVKVSYSQGLGEKEIAEIADELWGKTAKSKKIEAKVEEREEMRTGKKANVQPPPKNTNASAMFDDLF